MKFKELVEKRRSCRAYSDRKVSREDLLDIAETAVLSPSACNSQPWKLVVVDGEKAKLIPPFLQVADRPINRWTNNVTSFIIICETKAVLMPGVTCDSQYYAQMDIGLITSHLTLSAADKGLSTCIMGCFNEEKLKETFNIPQDVKIKLVLAVGYAKDDEIVKKIRKPFTDVVSFNGWE